MADIAPLTPRRRSFPILLRDAASTIFHFLRGQVLISLILTGFHLAGFALADVPLWWASGLLVGALTLIPYLGFLVGAVGGALLTVLAGGDHWAVVRLLAVMAVGQALEAFYLTPTIVGRRLKLHPALVFVLVLAGAIFFGPLGAFLAAPVAAITLLVWRFARNQDEPAA